MDRVLAIRCRIGKGLRRVRWGLRCRALRARRKKFLREFYIFLIRILDAVADAIALWHCYWGDPDDTWAKVAISRLV